MMGRRWARCWSLKGDKPYWDGKGSGWLPGNGEEGTGDDAGAEAPPEKTRLPGRVRLTPRRRIKRTR
jgi:hypothetical protein